MKKIFSILLCLCMLLQCMPMATFAVTADRHCAHHTEHMDCDYVEGVSECTYHCAVCAVQDLVDALPEEVSVENLDAVKAALTAIDTAKAELSDAELAQVDFAKYTAAISAINALEGLNGAEMPMTAMQIFIQVSSGTPVALEVEPTDRIEDIKLKIQDKTGIAPQNQRLLYADTQMEDGNTLQDYSIQKDATITVVQTYDVWVGGEQFTSEKLTINGTTGTATYDPATNTLSLNNATITGHYNESGIYSRNSLNIVFEGNNKIVASPDALNYGIRLDSSDVTLNISGNGNLDVSGHFDGINVESGSVTISGGLVKATGTWSYGLKADTTTINGTLILAGGVSSGNTALECADVTFGSNAHVMVHNDAAAKYAEFVTQPGWQRNSENISFSMEKVEDGSYFEYIGVGHATVIAADDGRTHTVSCGHIAAFTENHSIGTDGKCVCGYVEAYDLWVGGEQFTSEKLTINGTTGTATYDPVNNTLTLNDFCYNGGGHAGEVYSKSCEAVIYSDASLNILLDGNSVITHENSNYAPYSCGIFANGNITIADAEGGAVGTLQATGGNNASDTSGGIYATNSITINSGIITCKGGGTSDISGGIFADDKICVNGGEVNVSGENANSRSYGMAACQSVNISDGHVLATAGTADWNCLGIWGAFEGENVSGGIVYASGRDGGFNYVTVSGGQITATGNTAAFQYGCEIDSNFTACIYAGNDENGATEVTNPTADTYANKYVKIVPAYPVWVGGEQFTSEKLSIEGDSGTATYDPESKTLTLNNFSHTSEGYKFNPWMGSASIYATLEHLTVNIVGSNTITCSAEKGYALYNYGALTITADDTNGSLALTGDGDGIWVSGNLIINGCRVNATGIRSNGTIAITNSFVTANGARHGIAVVHAEEGDATEMKSDDLTITNSTVVATGGEYALFYDGGHNEEDESSIRGGLIPKLVFDNKFAAVVGSDAESAVMAAADAVATYENKHVRIVSVHDVTYKVDGEVVKTLTVEHGKDATAPEIPAKTGYTAAWSADGKNITADTEINAVYTINKYTVTYKADGKVVKTVEVEHGKDATAPEIPAKEGYNETAPKWDKDGKNITADTEINAVYTKNQPGEYADVTPDTNVGGGKVAEEIEELKEKVPFTPEEKLQIEYGADVEIWLEIKDISDSVSSEEKAKVEETLGDADVALYLDIAMFKQVGENEASRLTQLSDKVQITFKLDDSYINTDKDVTRTYSIIHVHDGKAEVITPVFDAATKTLTFETDRFSTYGVVYTDEKITPPAEIPAAGDSFQPAFWIACMTLSIFGMAVLLLDAKRRHAR